MKNVIYHFLAFFLFISLLTLFSCDTIEVPPKEKPPKDPRTYEWTLDTLKVSFQTDLRRIWGSASNNVYIGGHNASSTSTGALWHFDGNNWNPVELPRATFDANGIYGFSSSDVWAVGETTTGVRLILHYDGTKWKDYSTSNGKALRCIWGASSTDIWTTGTNTLFHFDGTTWKKYDFFIPSNGVHILSMNGLSSSNVYMVGGRNDAVDPIDTFFYYLYHFNGSQWSVVDSSYVTPNDYV